MTVTIYELGLYALAMAGLWIIPGPVWVALTARALSGGWAAAWPLAIGVTLGDLLWPFAAIFGLSWILSSYGEFLSVLRWVAAAVFLVMGASLIWRPTAMMSPDSRLTKPGRWAGFAVGVAAVIGNPKAILFYMGVLPGFFDLSRINGWDIAAILAISALVPFVGNLGLAVFLDRVRQVLQSPAALRRLNIGAGVLLVLVALVIPLT
jgi:threonine/homoserine/homoserine lactone efflux protein